MAPVGSLLRRSLRTFHVFGANTEVGKTVFTTFLASAVRHHFPREQSAFLKPVSTGALKDADDRCKHIRTFAPGVLHQTLFQFDDPVSPHIAARVLGKAPPTDDEILTRIRDHASTCASQGLGWLFVETAGGVHSPAPSGTTQADLYMPLRLPVILVGDHKLGGISQTISAFESLKIRGYDVETVLLFRDERYENYRYLGEYFLAHHDTPLATLQEPPSRRGNGVEDGVQMKAFYEKAITSSTAKETLQHLHRRHTERIRRLESMAEDANKTIWYPFTQQKLLTSKGITVIDSARGDYFQTLSPANNRSNSADESLLQPSFDGSASWWTQGLGRSSPQLTLAAAYASGRYGHIMFAETIHEPALALAESLLKTVQNPRLTRVFYSDNGSTGIEVAVKMALRAARVRYGWGSHEKLGIIGLKGGYHGDTIGAMDCAEPGVFNEKVEWYEGKGYWFDFPMVLRTNNDWVVRTPNSMTSFISTTSRFNDLNGIFDVKKREGSKEARAYERFISEKLRQLREQGRKFGALILEPVVLGAGGMAFVDPLFQRILVNTIRQSAHLFTSTAATLDNEDSTTWKGLPIIADEVFTGFYRLGRATACSFLGIKPDISVHAKLLTGGLLPLSATLASDSIFEAFKSDDKSDALLHGHSYTAHAVGCQVALESLKQMKMMVSNGEQQWMRDIPPVSSAVGPWSMWPSEFVNWVSRQTDRVEGVWALGCVLAIHMKSGDGAGYKSTAAAELKARLAQGDGDGDSRWNVHSRVLGNVFYLMGSLKTQVEDVAMLEDMIRRAL